jgi:hypothetical protein
LWNLISSAEVGLHGDYDGSDKFVAALGSDGIASHFWDRVEMQSSSMNIKNYSGVLIRFAKWISLPLSYPGGLYLDGRAHSNEPWQNLFSAIDSEPEWVKNEIIYPNDGQKSLQLKVSAEFGSSPTEGPLFAWDGLKVYGLSCGNP